MDRGKGKKGNHIKVSGGNPGLDIGGGTRSALTRGKKKKKRKFSSEKGARGFSLRKKKGGTKSKKGDPSLIF